MAQVGQPAGGDPLGQKGREERSKRGHMAEAVLGGVEEEYRVAPGCIGMRLVRQVSQSVSQSVSK